MNRQFPQGVAIPDDETLQVWENMRIEVLHELQEGASADVPDSYLDDIGYLIALLTPWRDQKKLRLPEASTSR